MKKQIKDNFDEMLKFGNTRREIVDRAREIIEEQANKLNQILDWIKEEFGFENKDEKTK